MRKTLLAFFFLSIFIFIGGTAVEAIEPETVKVANQVIQAVFDDMLRSADRYHDLNGLGAEHLVLNESGVLQIHYIQNEVSRPDVNPPLQIGVSVVPSRQTVVWEKDYPCVELMYPFLDLRIVIFQVDNKKARRYDLLKVIKKHCQRLDDHQQSFMPFRMSITPDRSEFAVGEMVGLTVRLENHSGVNLTVRRISEETLYLNIDGAEWGQFDVVAAGDQRRGRMILQPGRFIEKHFNVGPYSREGVVNIYGTYHVSFEGVKPSGRVSIKIVPTTDSS